ncbi:carboxylesterase type B [Penicillium hordei]|uniref:Carboxylic ester hydrolase n=1 Tax=Penicillium hordei TaxID=40994 RepID=A0AAD6GWT5_9EURO|nr:carboxylesterase type B [Penicillium hordei]KAJ5593683.1 carboxylesterase type B [Penicillium hordei]
MHYSHLWFASLILGTSLAANNLASNIVDLKYASYKGLKDHTQGVIQYYGIRYAEPPTFDHRWKAPIPVAKFPSSNPPMLNATSPGPQCMQVIPPWQTAGIASIGMDPSSYSASKNLHSSEDCLFLDVLVPESRKSSSLPVVVMIHGGGYVIGKKTESDGTGFVSASNGSVIWVQIQYRLGPYGFLAGGEIQSEGSSNVGLLDQRAALLWVQENIHHFGGDPSKVTIWGTSAGGGSVTMQMMLNGGDPNPPFRAAISEYPWWQSFHGEETIENQYRSLLQAAGCQSLSCLRNISSESLLNASLSSYGSAYMNGDFGYGDYFFGPTVDGTIIHGLPSEEFSSGRFSKVPLLVDHNSLEGLLFSNFSITSQFESSFNLQRLWPKWTPSFISRLLELYPDRKYTGSYYDDRALQSYSRLLPTLKNNTAFFKTQDIFGDFVINCPTYYVAAAVSDAGVPVWKLRFGAGTEVHGATDPYLRKASNSTDNPTLSRQMKEYFLSFILYLNPNHLTAVSKPQWPNYFDKNNTFATLHINQTSIWAGQDWDVSANCDFFKGQTSVLLNRGTAFVNWVAH